MTFDWALSKLRDGKKVYRKAHIVSWSRFVPWLQYKKLEYSDAIVWESVFSTKNALTPEDLEADDWEEWPGEESTDE